MNATSPDDLDGTNLFNDGTEEDIAAGQSGGAQSKAAKAEGRVQTANDEIDDEEEEFDDETPVSFPSRVNVTIEKVRLASSK